MISHKMQLGADADTVHEQGYRAPVQVPRSREACMEIWPLLHSILAALDPLTDKHVQPYEGAAGSDAAAVIFTAGWP